ncbi:DgyrCDS8794 [Dimorphilus gyrociliatus]|uniref:DgyrCDS8794 n=1 Tax=Dimorphilus gyrociliatus TaxID=2664684 RepID=A0A7I8VVF8_9ANNE|nr:DgyrCDS8794 [Dimorphilus gyrociliatus]
MNCALKFTLLLSLFFLYLTEARLPPLGRLDFNGEFHGMRGLREEYDAKDFNLQPEMGQELNDKQVLEFFIDQHFQDNDDD